MDTLTPEERSKRMSLVKSKDTKPELIVRRKLHGMGYRYRLHQRDLPGNPDIVVRKRRQAIFVHGCFWHRHNDPNCRLARMPKSKRHFWEPKLAANAERDQRNIAALTEMGWKVLVVWECELGNNEQLENKLRQFMKE